MGVACDQRYEEEGPQPGVGQHTQQPYAEVQEAIVLCFPHCVISTDNKLLWKAACCEGNIMQIIKNGRALCVSAMAEIIKIATEQPVDIRASASPSEADDVFDEAFPQLEERRIRQGPDHRQNGLREIHPVDFHHPKVPLRLGACLFHFVLDKSLGCLELKMDAKP